MITLDKFKLVFPNCKEPDSWHKIFTEELDHHGFNFDQGARFMAQCAHESNSFNTLIENLNYSVQGLLITFPKYFKDVKPEDYARQPAKIGSRVYANRMGNGDEASQEGFKFRGRGFIMVTGKANYMKCSEFLFGHDDVLLDEPDLLLDKTNAIGSAFWYWEANKCNDIKDFLALTKKINGGTKGAEERQKFYDAILKSV